MLKKLDAVFQLVCVLTQISIIMVNLIVKKSVPFADGFYYFQG